MAQFEALFTSLQVGRMTINNRVSMSCMGGGCSLDDGGYPNERMVAYYVERAKSRPGMMGIGAGSAVRPFQESKGRKYAVVIYDDGCIEPMKKLVDAVHEYDTKFGIQLWEGGIQTSNPIQLTPSGIGGDFAPAGDSSEQRSLKILTREEIADVVKQFGDAAERCVNAGFDFIEIHAGHGYLISSFMTPHYNHRTDEYGGSFENRVRFLREIMAEVKSRAGHAITIGVKINGSDYLPKNGWELEDSKRIAPLLEAWGADYIAASAAVMGAPRLTVAPLYEPQACYLEGAEIMKREVSIPVSIVGRIKTPAMADDLVREGKVDIVSMGRPFIADPEIIEKARTGRVADIRPCLADCRGCFEQYVRTSKRGEEAVTSCIVNPRVGREADCIDIAGDKAAAPKKVLVIGGGVAGMEAARRAAFSGHAVTLCEQGPVLGGQLLLAQRVPGRHEIGDILPWFEGQLEKLGVEVRLDTTADKRLLEVLQPDVVVVATGSLPKVPENLIGSLYNIEDMNIVMADDVFDSATEIGRSVLIVGGDQIGMQLADYISEQGAAVVVAEASHHMAQKLAANDRWYLTNRLIGKGVKRLKDVAAIEILPGDLVMLTVKGQLMELPGIDTIVLASERHSERTLLEICETMGIQAYVVGDASDIDSEDGATIFSAIAQGYDTARQI